MANLGAKATQYPSLKAIEPARQMKKYYRLDNQPKEFFGPANSPVEILDRER